MARAHALVVGGGGFYHRPECALGIYHRKQGRSVYHRLMRPRDTAGRAPEPKHPTYNHTNSQGNHKLAAGYHKNI